MKINLRFATSLVLSCALAGIPGIAAAQEPPNGDFEDGVGQSVSTGGFSSLTSTGFRLIMEVNFKTGGGRPDFDNFPPLELVDGGWGNQPNQFDQPLMYLYPGCLGVPPGPNKNNPKEATVKNCALGIGNGYSGIIALDNEFTGSKTALVNMSTWVKEAQPQAQVANYGQIPNIIGVGTAQNPNSSSWASWLQKTEDDLILAETNDGFIWAQVMNECDTQADVNRWKNAVNSRVYASMHLAEMVGKPDMFILPQTRPHFHNAGSCKGVGHGAADWIGKASFVSMIKHFIDIFEGRVNFGPTGAVKQLRSDGAIIWSGNSSTWAVAKTKGFWEAIKEVFGFTQDFA